MATITGYTAERMKAIEDSAVVSGAVNTMGNLILETHAGTNIDAGNVRGPQGIQGIPGVSGGSSNSRDAFYGVPSTDTDIAALANKAPIWYNTTTTKFETYMANSAVAGVNVPTTTKPSGWYPTAYIDRAPRGLIYRKTITVNTGAVSDAIVDNIPTFSFVGGRKYRIVWDTSYYQSASGDLFLWTINTAAVADGAASLTGLTQLTGRTKGINNNINSTLYTGAIFATFEPTADVTLQLKFRLKRMVGGGTIGLVSNADEIRTYSIYDDGAQAVTLESYP